ncbi:hypothetical protein N9L47_10245 [Rhodobacteraceae bacterium]|nr:hypothetical protein [Paracoccaceae bacterium]
MTGVLPFIALIAIALAFFLLVSWAFKKWSLAGHQVWPLKSKFAGAILLFMLLLAATAIAAALIFANGGCSGTVNVPPTCTGLPDAIGETMFITQLIIIFFSPIMALIAIPAILISEVLARRRT